MSYACILCDGANGPVVQITTSLETGATVSVCQADIPVALVGGLAAELGVDGERLYDAVKRWTEREVKRLEAANAALPAAFAAYDADAAQVAAAIVENYGQGAAAVESDFDPLPEVPEPQMYPADAAQYATALAAELGDEIEARAARDDDGDQDVAAAAQADSEVPSAE